MTLVLAFAIVLLAAVLVSSLAARSVLSTAVLFLGAGVLVGALDLVQPEATGGGVGAIAELVLFSVLFTDGMRVGIRELTSAWRLPGRALLFGMPLTLAGTAVLAHLVAGLPWAESLLLGAALAPTDPVFAAALVGRDEVPHRLRHLLNVESGLNDGLALPVVVIMLAAAGADTEVGPAFVELLTGVAIGVAIPWLAIRLERLPFFSASPTYEPLNGFAIGALVYGLSSVVHANLYLAAFAAGVTVATSAPQTRHAFHEFGELVTELLKLLALFVFGILIEPAFLAEIRLNGYVFALLALLLVRPVALGTALYGSGLRMKEQLVAAWFGPKGFASVVYGLLILNEGLPRGDELFHLVALVTAASIVAHSSTDVPIARRFVDQDVGSGTLESTAPDPDG